MVAREPDIPRPILAFFEEMMPERIGELTWDVDLVENNLLSSLFVAAFVFHLEEATGREIDLGKLSIDSFRTVRRINDEFFATELPRALDG